MKIKPGVAVLCKDSKELDFLKNLFKYADLSYLDEFPIVIYVYDTKLSWSNLSYYYQRKLRHGDFHTLVNLKTKLRNKKLKKILKEYVVENEKE